MRFGKNAKFGAGFFLAPDIDLGGRILADPDKRQTRNYAALLQIRNPLRQFTLDLSGDGPAVNDVVWVRDNKLSGWRWFPTLQCVGG